MRGRGRGRGRGRMGTIRNLHRIILAHHTCLPIRMVFLWPQMRYTVREYNALSFSPRHRYGH